MTNEIEIEFKVKAVNSLKNGFIRLTLENEALKKALDSGKSSGLLGGKFQNIVKDNIQTFMFESMNANVINSSPFDSIIVISEDDFKKLGFPNVNRIIKCKLILESADFV